MSFMIYTRLYHNNRYFYKPNSKLKIQRLVKGSITYPIPAFEKGLPASRMVTTITVITKKKTAGVDGGMPRLVLGYNNSPLRTIYSCLLWTFNSSPARAFNVTSLAICIITFKQTTLFTNFLNSVFNFLFCSKQTNNLSIL